MSKDIIYREDAIRAIHREARIAGGSVVIEYADMFQDAIEALPSADRPQDDEFKNFDRESLILLIEVQKERIGELLAERSQGEWVWDKDGMDWNIGAWICSECHARNANLPNYKKIIPLRWSGSKFCPNCGARMFTKDINVPNREGTDDE